MVSSLKYHIFSIIFNLKFLLTCQGSEVGKAKGSVRSDPEGGQHLECPCMVSTEGCRHCYILNVKCLG